jgi:hypothetical protein
VGNGAGRVQRKVEVWETEEVEGRVVLGSGRRVQVDGCVEG